MKALWAAPGMLGLPFALVAMLVMDAGVPLPIPTDLLLLLIGERAAAGVFPVWAAALGLELVAVGGSTLLFLAASGPAALLIGRLGPRIGLTQARVESGARVVRRGGRGSLVVGRATPGLRAATVLAAAAARLSPAYALPPLILGSSIFLQAHLVLGYFLGPAARDLLQHAGVPLILAALLLMAIGAAIWLLRRGGRAGARAWTEASCPVCLTIALAQRRAETESSPSLQGGGRFF
jgi:membrane protein DedA with SNARE-associated domain